jgi:hypothetical protein
LLTFSKVALIYNSPDTNNMIPYLTPDGTGLAAVASLRYEEGVQASRVICERISRRY